MQRVLIFIVSAVLVALSFVLWWPLALVAVALPLITGDSVFACMLALVCDLLWGVPVGRLHVVVLPCTLATVLLSILRAYVFSRMRPRVPRRV